MCPAKRCLCPHSRNSTKASLQPTSSSVDTQVAVNLEALTPEERRALASEHGFDDDGYDYVQHLAVTNRTQLAPTFMTTHAHQLVADEVWTLNRLSYFTICTYRLLLTPRKNRGRPTT